MRIKQSCLGDCGKCELLECGDVEMIPCVLDQIFQRVQKNEQNIKSIQTVIGNLSNKKEKGISLANCGDVDILEKEEEDGL